MSRRFLMGFDIGRRGGRCLLVDAESGPPTVVSRSWACAGAAGAGGPGLALPLAEIWEALGSAAREALARSGARPDEVAGIAASAERFSTILLDSGFRAMLATPGDDARASAEAERIAAEHGPALARCTGHWPAPWLAAPRLRRAAALDPDEFAWASTLLSLSDWLGYQLTGEVASEPTQAAATGLLDVESCDWAGDWLDRLGLERRLLPEIEAPGRLLGKLTRESAMHLGLRFRTRVAVGAADIQSAMLAAGALEPGDVAAVIGATAAAALVTERPRPEVGRRLWASPHLRAGRFVVGSEAGPLGAALDAWGAALPETSPEPAALRALALAAESSPGAEGETSTLGAIEGDAATLGFSLGGLPRRTAPRPEGLRTRQARAVVEGLAFALRAELERLGAGEPPLAGRRLHLVGGLAESELFAEIVGDVVGTPVRVAAGAEAAALGAAVLAGVGAGVFAGLEEGVAALVRATREHAPAPARAAPYAEAYARWKRALERAASGGPG